MKIEVKIRGGGTAKAKQPYAEAQHVVAEGATCPACGDSPLKVAGEAGATTESFDVIAGGAVCLRCRSRIGEIRAKLSTLFGVEEDRAVLSGRFRVY